MTDRYHILTVALKPDIRSDDAQPIIDAIKMIKGVVDVTPQVCDATAWWALENSRRELGRKLLEVLAPEKK